MSQKDQSDNVKDKNKKAETEENYGFIKEERVPQRKILKRMKVLRMILLVIGCGVLFGVIARCSYGFSDYIIRHFFTEKDREPVVLRPTPTMAVKPGNDTPPAIDEKALESYASIINGVKVAAAALEPSLTTVIYSKSVVDPVFEDVTESLVKTSGVVIADNGSEFLVYTSYSAMKAVEYDKIFVTFSGGRKERAYVYATAADADALMLSVSYKDFRNYEKEAIKAVTFGESSAMEPGTAVIAVGFPNGRGSSVDMGMITSRSQKVYVQDTSLEILETNMYGGRGESGILIDTKGELVGVITTAFGVSGSSIEAVAIDSVMPILSFLVNQTNYPKFGARFRDIDDDVLKQISIQNGIIIDEVKDGTIASSHQFRQGDIITEIGGRAVTSVEEFFLFYTSLTKGEEVEIVYYRNGKKNEKKIKIV
ncbi:MAG: serine protease [Lachnospiraceae bacterium]|nr:serine protease [Lachnospiraceae bacterium]